MGLKMAQCFEERSNPWTEVLAPHTTAEDVAIVRNMCREVNPSEWSSILASFYTQVIAARKARPPELIERDAAIPENWFHEPLYYLYVQYFATPDGAETATFDDLTAHLDYFERQGFKNIALLPHYESPMGDGGYDATEYVPRESLGGVEAYRRFMRACLERGLRVITDAPFNHTSIESPWFKAGMKGDDEKLKYYLLVNGRRKIGEEVRGGDIISRYEDPSGHQCALTNIFPDVDRTHFLRARRDQGDEVQIHRSFYPFQLDLDLRNPAVLNELFALLGRELNEGVLGKRTDAIAHWLKRAGTSNDGLSETHALQALFKSFMRHVCPRAVILPEVVRDPEEARKYAGIETRIRGQKTPSEGDAIFSFQNQAALREATYFQTSSAFWSVAQHQPRLPGNARALNLAEHHDETYLGLIRPHARYWLGKYIEKNGGRVYKNGMSAGGRYADCLKNDPERIAAAIFTLYLMPGTPAVYYGLETGQGNQHAHAEKMQAEQHAIFASLGVDIPFEAAFDPRELQRGPLPASELAAAEAEERAPLKTMARLNRLWSEHPTLSSTELTDIANGHDGVLSCVKLPTGESDDPPMLGIVNLTGETKHLRLPLAQYREKMGTEPGVSLHDLLKDRDIPVWKVDGHLELDLAPRDFLLSQ